MNFILLIIFMYMYALIFYKAFIIHIIPKGFLLGFFSLPLFLLKRNERLKSCGLWQGFANALKRVKEMKDMEEELNDKLTFLSGFVASFKDQIHTDIQVKPGTDGSSPIHAHRALLVNFLIIFSL